jgi:threonine/homoserine/homoserine lactone efflux protein
MNALIAAWSLRSFRHGFAAGAGAMSADFLLTLFALTLYDVLKGLGQRFFAPFHAAGGLFFLYLAYKIGAAKPPREGSAGGRHLLRGYLLGLLLGLINPYQVAWWLTARLGSIAHLGVEWAAELFFAILTWITAFPAAVRSGWRLNSRLTWLAIKFFSVTVLVAFGVLFVYTAASLVLDEG